jgi:hypothetical protein
LICNYTKSHVFTYDRFGRKDGLGALTTRYGTVIERGIYRDTSNFEDVYPPYIYEVTLPDLKDEVDEEESEKETKKGKVVIPYYNPPSLLIIGLEEVVRHMQLKTDHFGKQSSFITPNMVNDILPYHLKQMLSSFYIHGRTPKGSAGFSDFAIKNNLGFSSPESVACRGVKMNSQDVEILCYIQGANIKLKTLELTLNKLDATGISRLVHSLNSRLWPILMKLDLSLNILDISSLKNILNGLLEVFSLRSLRLSNCGIQSSGAQMIADFLTTNFFLEELDLSFNTGFFLCLFNTGLYVLRIC